jgi:hypothetical protein
MLYDEIKKANIEAMKNKDALARSIYSVLLNKFMLENIKKREKGEEVTDADISNIMQKTIKELSEEKENYLKVSNTSEAEKIDGQIKIIEKFLPKMMSKEEVASVISSLDDKSIPAVMKHFKTNFNGKCDMRMVQEVLKEMQ